MSNEEKNRYYWSLMAENNSSGLLVDQYLWQDEPKKTIPYRSKNRLLLWLTSIICLIVLGIPLSVEVYQICQQKIPVIKRQLSPKESSHTLS